VLDKVTATVGVFGRVETKQISTDKLCVEDVCITKTELKDLLDSKNIHSDYNGSTTDQGQILYPGLSNLDYSSTTKTITNIEPVASTTDTIENIASSTPEVDKAPTDTPEAEVSASE
jgi:hypothetical protein